MDSRVNTAAEPAPKKWVEIKIIFYLVVTVIIAVVGLVLIISHNKHYSVSTEAEQGYAADGAVVISDAKASAGKGIQFASPGDPTKLRPYGFGIAPYAYLPWGGSTDGVRAESGVKNYIAAFMLNVPGSVCTPAWDGDASLGLSSARSTEIAQDFAKLRSNGGDVMLSFGGASGTELASGCNSAESLKQAYRSVINKYNLDNVDFDIEGNNARDAAANERRADALSALQKELPGLRVWVTLSTEPSGLDSTGVNIVKQLRDKGVVLSGINLMVMDYGDGVTQMGQAAIQAATATFSQLKGLYGANSDAEVWKAIGLTAMVGINDTKPEVFTLQNAQEVHDFAVQKGIGMLSEWNVDRDKACPGNAATLSDSCSGVAQNAYQFMKTMTIPATH